MDFCKRAMPHIKAAIGGAGAATQLDDLNAPVLLNLGNGLVVLYAVDTGNQFEFVQNRHLQAEGLTPDSLHDVAMQNFVAYMADKTRVVPQNRAFGLLLDGNLEASLILVDQLWDEALASRAPSGYVIAVPARDVLAFCDKSSLQGIKELRAIVAKLFPKGNHLLSSDLFVREAGRWVRLA